MDIFQEPRVFSVTELARFIRGVLETEFPFVSVTGEISNLKRPMSGHLYFTLKDNAAQIRTVLFKTQQRYLAFEPRDGLAVVCRGRITVYEPRGDCQLIADYLELMGHGNLLAAFEALKKRLAAEGLFDGAHKKTLPLLPEKIALLTSPAGAAVSDFLRIATRRFPGIDVELYPVAVQGDGAAAEMTAALVRIGRERTADVIVLCRGGGSAEDLWAFNDESLARAIYASAIPVVTGIGHEIDCSIADFVADLRAPTPSAAAELVVPEKDALAIRVTELNGRMQTALNRKIGASRLSVDMFRRILRDPSHLLAHAFLKADHLFSRLRLAATAAADGRRQLLAVQNALLEKHRPDLVLSYAGQKIAQLRARLTQTAGDTLRDHRDVVRRQRLLLAACDPMAVLARGYAIVSALPRGGTVPQPAILSSSAQVSPGDAVEVRLHRGALVCAVTAVQKPQPPGRAG